MISLTAPEASGIAATLAFVVGMSTVVQKARNDRRDAWWKRAQWAIDRALGADDVSRQVGTDAMNVLVGTAGRNRDDLRILLAASQRALDTAGGGGDDEGDRGSEGEVVG